ncbi:MAG: hypothetical protein LBH08_00005, partial [Puniceicoccales bacterium]|nr:hypothetical protein [Puniceicoccales bacterium]
KTRDLTLVNAWKQKQLSKRGQKLLGTWIQRLITTQDLQKLKTYDQNKEILLNEWMIPEQYKIWMQKLLNARIRELASETQQ